MLRDLSASGAFIVTKRTIDAGKIVSLELRVPHPATLALISYSVAARVDGLEIQLRALVGQVEQLTDQVRKLIAQDARYPARDADRETRGVE